MAIRGAAIVYYFKYYLGNVEAAATVHGGRLGHVCNWHFPDPVRDAVHRAEERLYRLNAACYGDIGASYWVTAGSVVLLYVYNIIYCVLTGPTSALLWAMFAELPITRNGKPGAARRD